MTDPRTDRALEVVKAYVTNPFRYHHQLNMAAIRHLIEKVEEARK